LDAARSNLRISLGFLFLATFACQMLVGVNGIAVPIYTSLMEASPVLVGLIGSAGGAVYSFMPMVSGVLCDRLGRKTFISVSLFSYGFSSLLYSIVEDPVMMIPIKILEWISIAAFWPSVESLIADSAPANLEEALKRFNISWGSAMIIGPLLGGALISELSIKAPFFFSVIVALTLGGLSIPIIKEPGRTRHVDEHSQGGSQRNVRRISSILPALVSIFLFSSTVGILVSLFPSYATSLGISPIEIGAVTFAFGAARAVTFYQATGIEAKIKKKGMFLAGALAMSLAAIITFWSRWTLLFMFSFLIFGFGAGVSYAASIASILSWRRSSRGYSAGLFESLIGVGYFIGPLLGGFLSEFAGNAPYIYVFLLSLMVLGVLLRYRNPIP
jgi:DHA1 family quinolone resistance protein-like MFS transporter